MTDRTVFDDICTYTERHGRAPTAEWIREQINFREAGPIGRAMDALVAAGEFYLASMADRRNYRR